ncbi:quinol:cytochrome C oxidoreductase [Limibacter armeniacum]|uniref:quinol:cytochrome C oxidoreductase n=1 Tax=Limibacter armeniacum TaxID=466084 RepID=UPI002FE649C1
MAHVDVDINNIQEQFSFSGDLKKKILGIGGLGVLVLVIGIVMLMFGGGHGHEEHHAALEAAANVASVASDGHGHAADVAAHAEGGEHHGGFHWTTVLKTNLWMNAVYFIGIALLGFFFFTIQFAANAGWSTPVQRIMLNFGRFIPIGGAILLVAFLIGNHDIFHWTHSYLFDPTSPEFDPVIKGKEGFLNLPFYLVRMVVFVAVWTVFFFMLNKLSTNEDLHVGSTVHFRRTQRISVAFLIFFGVSESIASWDWIMSIDTHWYSTLFGWYCLASWLVTAVSSITLVAVILKEMGYLKIVNENHFHDLGKFIFGFSIFWSYLFLAQFLLIYYANIPEETIYFIERLRSGNYFWIFVTMLLFNFVMPFFIMMTRDAKRKTMFLKIVTVVIIIGHWLDFYLMITPGVLKENGGMTLSAIGMGLVFLSGFAYVIFNGLTKAGLIPQNHPMIEEGIYHHT